MKIISIVLIVMAALLTAFLMCDDWLFDRDDLPTFLRWGNNMAYENQRVGVIVPFRWTATFNELRGSF